MSNDLQGHNYPAVVVGCAVVVAGIETGQVGEDFGKVASGRMISGKVGAAAITASQ